MAYREEMKQENMMSEGAKGHLSQGFQDIDESTMLTAQEKRKLTIKLDLRLLPILWLLYFINLLDRVSVGGAVAYGFRTDIGVTGQLYNIGISVFYVVYCLAEVPSNLILKKVSAKLWLPILALAYGACSLATAFINNGASFIALRVLLGIFEAGTLPGCSYFLSTYYDTDQFSLRLALFISASALASAVGSLLAYAYNSLGEITPLVYGWRNIFLINGLITIGVAIPAFWILPWSPDKEPMLSDRERAYIMARNTRLSAGLAKEEATKGSLVWRAFKSPTSWFGVVPWFVAQVLASSLTFFLAQILVGFGYSGNAANVRVAATFLVSFGVCILFGFLANMTHHHAGFVIAGILLGLFGSALFAFADNNDARYAGAFFANMGIFSGVGINTSWVASNMNPYTTRATGTAIAISVGSLGGIVGAWVFRAEEAPEYLSGAITTVTLLAAALVITIGHVIWCKWENAQRAKGKRDYRLDASPEEVELLGSLHPSFRYVI